VPCLHYGVVALCGVGLLGSLQAWSSNVTHAKSSQTVFGAAGGRLALEVPLSSALALRAQLDLLDNLTGARLFINETAVWTAPSAVMTAGAGAAMRFP
jgi:hypothetical protein